MEILLEADHCFAQKKYQKAYKLYLAAETDEKDRAFALLGQTNCLLFFRKNKQARECAMRALAMEPNLSHAHLALAYLHVRQEEWEQGMLEVQEALAIQPESMEAREMLCGLLIQQNKKEEAFEMLNQLIQIGKDNWLTHAHLGNLYQLSRDDKKAISEYRLSLKKKFSLNTILRITETFLQRHTLACFITTLIILFLLIRVLHLFWAPFFLCGLAILYGLFGLISAGGKRYWLYIFLIILLAALFYLLIYRSVAA